MMKYRVKTYKITWMLGNELLPISIVKLILCNINIDILSLD